MENLTDMELLTEFKKVEEALIECKHTSAELQAKSFQLSSEIQKRGLISYDSVELGNQK